MIVPVIVINYNDLCEYPAMSTDIDADLDTDIERGREARKADDDSEDEVEGGFS